jgi:alpha-L-rhamnosidase
MLRVRAYHGCALLFLINSFIFILILFQLFTHLYVYLYIIVYVSIYLFISFIYLFDFLFANLSFSSISAPSLFYKFFFPEATVYGGEFYDSRREMIGWDKPNFVASSDSWFPVTVLSHAKDGPSLDSQLMPPILRVRTLAAVRASRSRLSDQNNAIIVDFGQNFAGWVNVSISTHLLQKFVRSDNETITLIIQYAELLNVTTGDLIRVNLGFARAIDKFTFILSSNSPAVVYYEPRFTYHGFRFVKLSLVYTADPQGLPIFFTQDCIRPVGVVLANDLKLVGQLGFSNDLLTQLQHNIVWSLRSQLFSIPTDCPNRDERLGY